ncbi:TPA: ABC transporter ATP-binding protein [Streptococcus equi subsp. equi]|uniref:ABC transporter ATP-binding protein n=1 Tax=Streptococcus equi TaxID=1336 RepID=UPI00065905F0|nr:ABC transporter ATP-binding protein [Streptococcus equi]CRW07732.1 ABC transporter ATP-binding protein [Streptococcus equi subsp. equi]HEK9104498.1 ABC transporter ATP-binding protein [Streptococcus equi subsp. equi]HEK9487497.1 ABC transporter ATP-binding protein [Streptococcus equi subsp. equi]HEK9491433.1 ABC transporter ATP-binding protein [Streptococcus equi subsp. equi]HEK9733877.1 ABC transporter ATP-binding protein [Streptococcus equi subsp. equi]
MEQYELMVRSLSKRYARDGSYANRDLHCVFKSSEITALIGHNGAGKTTLLNQIIGNIKPDVGDISFLDCSFIKSPKIARKNTSMMPQLHAPLKGITIKQAISSIGKIRGLSGKLLETEVQELIQELGLIKWQNTVGEKLSGGLKRLTSFAMAVIAAPKIVLLDEPTNDVDPIRRIKLWLYLKKMAAKGHIVIVVTHNILEVEKYADAYYLLEKGEVKSSGAVKTLSSNPKSRISILFRDQKALEEYPFAYSLGGDDNEAITIMDNKEMTALLNWLGIHLSSDTIVQYSITTLGLNDYYEELSDEED